MHGLCMEIIYALDADGDVRRISSIGKEAISHVTAIALSARRPRPTSWQAHMSPREFKLGPRLEGQLNAPQ
jgi:hypothetical protein